MSEQTKTEYRVLARKYRSQNFDELVGQGPMVQTLANAFETGRIAQAYMLTGVRGVGKTSTARILARALNYKTDKIDKPTIDIAELGEHCQAIMDGRHVDIIEMDAASHTGIDDIRDLIESAQYKPVSARYKVYIIDEVHMLSKSAFNGLLKTLEEPPEHVKFIFATTEIRKVPVTILSRCQRFDLRRIDAATLTEHLQKICKMEKVEVEEEALAIIARASEGSVRDALSMLDQAMAHGSAGIVKAESIRSMLGLADRTRIIDLFEHIMKGDIASAMGELKAQYDIGADPLVVLSDLADFIHFVTKLKYIPSAAEDKSLSEAERSRGGEFAEKLSVRVLGRAWQILLKGMSEVQTSERALASADMVLIRMTHAADLPTPDELIRKIQDGQSVTGSSPSPNGGGGSSPAGQGSGQSSSSGARVLADAAPNSGPTLVVSSGAATAALQVSEAAPETGVPERMLNTFDELIFLVEDKRDLAMKTYLRRNVRVVSFSDGRMEVNLVENPPKTFLTDLSKKLQAWTGKRWMISTSSQEGAPTLDEIEQAETAAIVEQARTDPTVEAILERFPGSRIIDVRIRLEEALEDGEADGEDNEDEDGLDDFFE
ncbi:MAG: DNA polymerase III subunit gamma/tau [Rhizobiaceae bacterium]|nr:DNA polymerase III subunit gamma/tau [Rhizobiaceae bacterium]PCI02748.1 MAG: DNA polymerase III subunit gamma/tau [Hyphomicrobiales bacterium]